MDVGARFVVAALSVGMASVAQAQTTTLSCAGDEATALRQAPLGASRASPGRLTVNWAGGSTVLADSGAQEGYIGGTAYRYCGFSPTIGVHLIRLDDGDLFTGVLLDHASGRIMPAGHKVTFAPDGTKYFAIAQPNGLDGEEWFLYSRDGSLIWEGLSGITEQHPSYNYEYFVATLDRPRWNGVGEFQATLTCRIGPSGLSATVALTRDNDGWTWLPRIPCMSAKERSVGSMLIRKGAA